MESEQLSREEFANALTHGVGLLLAVAATPVMIMSAVAKGGVGDIVGAAVFGASMIVLYLSSTVLHASPDGSLKERMLRLDHAAIYILIAGTYTPFTLGVMGGAWGWSLFGVIWALAVVGVLSKLTLGNRYPRLSLVMYVLMGWLILVALRPLVTSISTTALYWLVAGGVAYTAGVPFFASNKLRYSHAIWHLFVLTGSVCHFFAVMQGAL